MELGWIDFSKSEREKILSILDLLTEPGVLDELGISPIRDGYSNLFFPGTSTIQTRAKYFFIVPYALKDLELNNKKNYGELKSILNKTEEKCAKNLLAKEKSMKKLLGNDFREWGIIGRRSLDSSNKWIKRTPASIYWAGLRRYQIFNAKMSIDQYIKIIALQKQAKSNVVKLGNRNDESEWQDVKNAGVSQKVQLLKLPSYDPDWINKFNMNLTFEEGQFLKDQICSSCKKSMLAHILKENMYNVLEINSFRELDIKEIMDKFPETIQKDYYRAKAFSEFVYVLRIIYNRIVSENKNQKANMAFEKLEPKLEDIAAEVKIEEIFSSLKIFNPYLKKFLINSKDAMLNSNEDDLNNLIKDRELMLKGENRSRTAHPGEFDISAWFSGDRLEYRFRNAKNIIRDIFVSENPDLAKIYAVDNGIEDNRMRGL